MKIVVVSTNKKIFNNNFIKFLKKNFKFHEFVLVNKINLKKIEQSLPDASALINCPYYIFQKLKIFKYPTLKWIHTGSAGVENFFTEELKSNSVILTNGKIIQGIEIADHAIGLILAFSRNIHQYIKKMDPNKITRPIELNKKHCAIVGLGGIGLCIAERLKTFGMKIDGYNNELIPLVSFINQLLPLRDLYSNLQIYDVVISALPLTKYTEKFFNKKFFLKMKKNSIFINVSRGKVVDQNSFEDKKLIKKFRGIGLDVTDPEPLSKNSLLYNSENIILTNHTAGHSDNNRDRSKELVIENIKRFILKENLINVVDKNKEY